MKRVASDTDEYRERLTYLRERVAELREDFRFIEGEYRHGRLSLAEEVALIADMTRDVTAIVAEYVALTRSPALF